MSDQQVTSTAVLGAPPSPEFNASTGWTVTLTYGPRKLTIPFYMGSAHKQTPPDTADVLGCLLCDARSYEGADSFEEFAQEMGYDTDSRKAERVYRACAELTKKIRRLLGSDFEEFFQMDDDQIEARCA